VTAGGPDEAALRALVQRLGAARDAAAALAGQAPVGVRAVEPAYGRRNYLCAFEGPAFLCLDDRLAAERDPHRVRQAASASLLWEQVEALVDAGSLRDLAGAIGRLLALGGDPPEVAASLEVVAARALDLARWRDDPARAVASVPEIDRATALQARLAGAYQRFLRASEPLVEVQDRLDAGLVEALRDVEQRAAPAGAAERLADRLAAAMPESEDGADQVVNAHLTRLAEEPGET
jgi:hypothetical protein